MKKFCFDKYITKISDSKSNILFDYTLNKRISVNTFDLIEISKEINKLIYLFFKNKKNNTL